MSLFSNLEAGVRASTDMPDVGRLPQATILAFANDEYAEVIRRIAEFAPDLYRAISADLTIAPGATSLDISSLTTLMQIQEFQWKRSGRYLGLEPAGVNAEIDGFRRSWRQRGLPGVGCVVDVFPPERAPGDYRVLYTAFPGALTASPDAELRIPLGGLRVFVEAVSARVRVREEEDPSFHIKAREDAYDNLRRGLQGKGGVIGTRGRY